MERTDDLTLEQYLLGELPEDEQQRMDKHLARNPELGLRLAALKKDNLTFLEQHPPQVFLARCLRDAGRPSPKRPPFAFRFWRWVPLAAPLLLALFVLMPWSPATTRTKGGPKDPALSLRLAHRAQPCTPGEVLEPGARIQIHYLSPQDAWGCILSLDGRGQITRHLPLAGERAVHLETGKTTALPQSFELDDAPRGELFLLFTSSEPFDLPPLLKNLQAQINPGAFPRTWSLPPSIQVTSFFVGKTGK